MKYNDTSGRFRLLLTLLKDKLFQLLKSFFLKQLKNYKLVLFILFFLSTNAFAVNYQQFHRSHSLTFEKIEDARTATSHVYNDYDLLFHLGYSFVDEPLVAKDAANSQQLYTIIDDMQTIHLGLSWFMKPWLLAGVNTGYSFFNDDSNLGHSGFSDIVLSLKLRLHSTEKSGLAVIPQFFIPTYAGSFTVSNQAPFGVSGSQLTALSDESFGFGLKLVYEYIFKYFQVVGNVGYRYADKAVDYQNGSTPNQIAIDLRNRLTAALGFYIPIQRSWGINLEYLRQWSQPFFENDIDPNELFIGASGALSRHLHAFAGVGVGNLLTTDDGNDFRGSLGIKYNIHFEPHKIPITRVNKKGAVQVLKGVQSQKECEPPVFGESNAVVIRFMHDRAELKSEHAQINQLIQVLSSRRDIVESLILSGHTSKPGSNEYNLNLATRRLNKVAELLSNSEIADLPIQTQVAGETIPLSDDDSALADKINRRVEILVKPKQGVEMCTNEVIGAAL